MEEIDVKKRFRLFNISETADILGISISKFYALRNEKKFTDLNLCGKYYTIEEIERIKNYIIFGH